MDKKELKIYILPDESFFNNPSNYNSEKYRPIRMIRHKNATSNAIIIKGT